QFLPLVEAARQRAARLESFLEEVSRCEALHADEIDEYELVVAWDGASSRPRRFRDVVKHPRRETFLVREWELGSEPHSIVEHETLAQALSAANNKPGVLRRRRARC